MLFPLVLAAILGVVYADYPCICNYAVELGVYAQPSVNTSPLGYLYENECRPIVWGGPSGWATIAFEGKAAYIIRKIKVVEGMCPGNPSPIDIGTLVMPTPIGK